ncbi:PepSY domain-containing protein [Pseudonocardia sp. CA-107938]|uniref:PepSY-associated TM helix domain-containing protein n=1 Tax=Pseudonocardia sp. CA-107938 TaxID=3240021 RepID=UPI003D8ECBEC
MQLRPLARRVHFLAGLLVAPFLLLLCLTGLVYVFSPQVHEDLYRGQLFVSQVGAERHPVANQVAAALRAHPEAHVQSVVPPDAPDRTTRVNLHVPGMDKPGDARTVFVDPYTDFINGELLTSDGRLPANVWLRELHSDLHLGEVGRWYSEIAASWVPVIVAGGLIVWLTKQGRRRRTAAELLVPVPRGNGDMSRLRSVHGPLGLWLTAGLLVVGVTGLLMSRLAGWGLPSAREPRLAMAPISPESSVPIGIDDVLAVAREEGLTGQLLVTPPAAPDRPFSVVETSTGLPIHKGAISVDPYTARVTERIGWDDYPLLAQLREVGVQFHTGTLFGLANQILLTLVVLGTIALILGGYRMWWKRNPFRSTATPPPPRALAALPWPVAAGIAAVVVVLGWLLPAFAISLVAFLLVDVLIRAFRDGSALARTTAAAGTVALAAALIAFAVLPTAAPTTGQPIGAGPAPGPREPDVPPSGGELNPWTVDRPPGGTLDVGAAPLAPRRQPVVQRFSAGDAVAPDAAATSTDPSADGPGGGAASEDSPDVPLTSPVGPTTTAPAPQPAGPGATPAPQPAGPGASPAPSPGVVQNLIGILTGTLAPVTGDLLGSVTAVTGQQPRN